MHVKSFKQHTNHTVWRMPTHTTACSKSIFAQTKDFSVNHAVSPNCPLVSQGVEDISSLIFFHFC